MSEGIMNRNKLGKWLLSFVLVVGALISTIVDWNTTHLFNPAWHPHARFHDALFLMIVDAMTLVTLWLLWRQSREPQVGLKVAALFAAAVWTPFFYIEALIPGTSLLATDNVPVLKLGGMVFAPNLIVAIVLVLLTVIAYWLARDPNGGA
jgi:hypothetical protein